MNKAYVRKYCRRVKSYLPCSCKQKRQILSELRRRVEETLAEQPTASLEEVFGTPQQVAASYVDEMSTTELLAALRLRRRVAAILTIGVVAVAVIWAAAVWYQVYDSHQSLDGWDAQYITEE